MSILYKTLTGEQVLNLLAEILCSALPEDDLDSDAEMTLTFQEDHSVKIYLVNPDKENIS